MGLCEGRGCQDPPWHHCWWENSLTRVVLHPKLGRGMEAGLLLSAPSLLLVSPKPIHDCWSDPPPKPTTALNQIPPEPMMACQNPSHPPNPTHGQEPEPPHPPTHYGTPDALSLFRNPEPDSPKPTHAHQPDLPNPSDGPEPVPPLLPIPSPRYPKPALSIPSSGGLQCRVPLRGCENTTQRRRGRSRSCVTEPPHAVTTPWHSHHQGCWGQPEQP